MEKKELSKKEKMSQAVDSAIRKLTSFNEKGTEIEKAKVEKIESKRLVNYEPSDIPEDCLEECKGITFIGIVRISKPVGDGFSSELFNLEVKIKLDYVDENFRVSIITPALISKYISHI